MQGLLSQRDLDEIKSRLVALPSGAYEVTSIGVKNYLLWAGGNWEEKYDLPLHQFFCQAKNDVENLISDLEFYKCRVSELEAEINRIQQSFEDDGR